MQKTKRRHRRTGRTVSEGLKHYHAYKTPAQANDHRRRTSFGMRVWHEGRDEADRETTRQKQIDAAVSKIWLPHQPGTKFQKGHTLVGNTTPDALERRSLRRVEKASIKRILDDLAGVQPEMFRNAIIAGLLAPPPRSFPYVALAAAYLDGKPVDADADLHTAKSEDLTNLTNDELRQRALALAERLQRHAERAVDARGLPVIDVTPEPHR